MTPYLMSEGSDAEKTEVIREMCAETDLEQFGYAPTDAPTRAPAKPEEIAQGSSEGGDGVPLVVRVIEAALALLVAAIIVALWGLL